MNFKVKFYRNFIIYWILFYLLVAFSGRFLSEKREFYPFFRWSLYSKSYDKLRIPFIMVTKMKDSVFEKPKNLNELKKIHSLTYLDIHDELLSVKKFIDKRKPIESVFFNSFLSQDCHYKIYYRVYDLTEVEYGNPEIKRIAEYKNSELSYYKDE